MTKHNYLFLLILSLAVHTHLHAAQAAQKNQRQCLAQKTIDVSLNEAMWTAIERNQIDVLRQLFSGKRIPDINAIEENDDGLESTALMKAVHNTAITQFLLDHGAQIDKATADGTTALLEAAEYGTPAVVQLLINHHADVHARGDLGTPLMYAAFTRDRLAPEKINLLLSHGANPNAQDTYGRTALMWAVLKENIAAVQPLVAGGADPYLQNALENNKTAFDYAIEKGFGDAYQAAVAAGEKEKAARRAQYNREVVEPMIVESVEEVDFPPELAGEVAEYANIDLNSQCRKRKR